MNAVWRAHDATSQALFALAGVALITATGLYLFEVTARYIFNAPTTWSNEAVQYCLAIIVFGALPEATRGLAHVAIDIVPTSLPPRIAGPLMRFNAALASVACGASAWIATREALRQFDRGLMTNAAHPIPRWWITAIIAFGLASAALHFLRHAADRAR